MDETGAIPLSGVYCRHEPEKTVLRGIVREHLETFLARRAGDTSAWLVDHLLPEAGYRQWVLTFPWSLRFRLAMDRALFHELLTVFLRTLFAWQRRRGRERGIVGGHTGAVTFVQRFGGALNLNPHVHSVLPDGLWVVDSSAGGGTVGPLRFEPLPAPTTAEVEELAGAVIESSLSMSGRSDSLGARAGSSCRRAAQGSEEGGGRARIVTLSAPLGAGRVVRGQPKVAKAREQGGAA